MTAGSQSGDSKAAAPRELSSSRLLSEDVTECAIYLLNAKGRVATWNTGAQHLKQYLPEEIIGQHYSCFYLPEDVAAGRPDAELTHALADGFMEDEAWRRRKDGSLFLAHLMTTPLHNPAGENIGFARVTRDLTHKRQEEHLRMVVTSVLDGIISFCERGAIQSFNLAAQHIFGYSEAQALGRNVRELLPQFCAEEIDNLLSPAPETMAPRIIGLDQQASGLRQDGSTFPMDLTVSEFSHDGKRYFTGVVRDATERENSEARRQAILDNVSDMIITVDSQGRIQSANRAAEELSGYSAGELIGQPVSLLTPDEQRPHVIALEQQLFNGELSRATGLEVIGRSKEGTLRPFELSLNAFMLGTERHVIAVARDVSELKGKEARLRAILDNASDAITTVGEDGRIQSFNRAAEEMYGFTEGEIQGEDVLALLPEEQHRYFKDVVRRVGAGELLEFRNLESQGRRKDGTLFPLELSLNTILLGDKRIIIGLNRDITERKLAADALRHSHARMQNAQSVAHVGDFEWDVSTHQSTWSDEYFRILGLEPQSFEPNFAKAIELVHPDDRAKVVATAESGQAHRGSTIVDYRIVRPDGEVRYVEGRGEYPALTDPLGEQQERYLVSGTMLDVTERAQSELRLRAILDNASDAIMTADEDGRVESFNRAAEYIYGYTEREMIGHEVFKLSPPELRPLFKDLVGRMCRGELASYRSSDHPGLRKNGTIFPREISLSVIEVGSRHLVIGVIRDITERKRADDAQLVTQGKMEKAQELAHIGNWEVDLASGVSSWSDEMYRIYGIATDVAIHMADSLAWSHPEDRDRIAGIMREAATHAGEFQFDFRLLRPDGEQRYVEARGETCVDSQGTPITMRGTVQDITERTLAAAAVVLSRQRMENAQHEAQLGDWEWDIARDTFSVSDEFFRLYGLEPQSRIIDLATGLEMIHPDDRERIRAEVNEVLKSGDSHRFEYRLLRPDGELRYVDGHCTVHLGPDGQPVVLRGTLQDITERKLAQQESEKLGQQLRQSQKMEAIGKLAGGVAHDFNNMLTVINGYSQMALDELPEGHALRDYLTEIHRAGDRAALITSQLLAFSRQQVLAPRVLNLNTVVAEMEKMLHRLIGEDVSIESALDPQLNPIKVDQGQIVQVIMNLAVNARDAMPQGGKLTIETRNLQIDAERAAILPDCRPGHFVMLAISDNGAGMTPDVKARAFEPFFTTKGPGQGTGLGLSTVYGIIKQSGGNIEVYSEAGIGTAFKIYFPAISSATAVHQLTEVVTPVGGSETILLVEDELAVRKVALRVLEKLGYVVLEADGGTQALELAQTHAGQIDLLLTDIVMPGLSGREVAEMIQPLLPGIKVLYMSGYTDDAVVRHGLVSNSVAFLQKPFTPSSIGIKVREVLDGS